MNSVRSNVSDFTVIQLDHRRHLLKKKSSLKHQIKQGAANLTFLSVVDARKKRLWNSKSVEMLKKNHFK